MSKIKPFSAFYYIRENKGRSILCMFMMFLSAFIFLAGNFIQSVVHAFDKCSEYSDKLVVASIQSTDEEYRDWEEFQSRVRKDDKLEYVVSSAQGFACMSFKTVLLDNNSAFSWVFNSVSDMEKVFDHLGITGDFSNCGHKSIVISSAFAKNKGIKIGDKVDHGFDSNLNGEYTVDALIEDGSYVTFYVYEDDEGLGRLILFSDSMEGEKLYDYVRNLAGDLKVQIEESARTVIMPQFDIFDVIYFGLDILIAIVLAVTIHSVVTGQYLKRTYEYGVYRAIGMDKKKIKRKVAAEILVQNIIACIAGIIVVLLLTYLLNELYYEPRGMHLLYYSNAGLTGFLLCDAIIVLPLTISKGIQMSKADVTEF